MRRARPLTHTRNGSPQGACRDPRSVIALFGAQARCGGEDPQDRVFFGGVLAQGSGIA
jgi:hypothetical protein